MLPRLFPALVSATEPDLTRYLVVSGALLGALVLAGFLVRRIAGGGGLSLGSKRSMQLLDAVSLGGSKRALVVRCYDRTFLLGVGDKEVCSIAELDAAAVAVDRKEAAEGTRDFAGLLGDRRAARAEAAKAPRETEARRRVARELLDQLADRDLVPAPKAAEARPAEPAPSGKPRSVSELLDGRGVLG